MSKGYVYALSNKAMPGILKIGRSKHSGVSRARSMYSGNTGVALPFKFEFECFFDDCVEAELLVHEELQDYRVNESREFFEVGVHDASVCILGVAASYYDMAVVFGDFHMVIDEIYHVAHKLDCHPMVLNSAARFIPDEVWADAYQKQLEFVEAKKNA